jgi:toxin ParE1/3/4
MPFSVLLTDDAARDLEELCEYIAHSDSPGKAGAVLNKIESLFEKLGAFPERGSYPKELIALGIREYRQVLFKPYRIIYQTIDKNVYVLLIADGRRDMQALLERRLFAAD